MIFKKRFFPAAKSQDFEKEVGDKDKNKENLDVQKLLEDFKKCQEDLAGLTKEKDEYLAGWQRERADFLNYKKEQAGIFEDIQKFANQNLILEILPILDNIEIAIRHLPEDLKNNDWASGILKIRDQFKNILKNQGVEEMKIGEGKFDPEFHEAIERVESEEEEGKIIEEVRKGYLMAGKVIRPSRVKVAVKRTTNNKQQTTS